MIATHTHTHTHTHHALGLVRHVEPRGGSA